MHLKINTIFILKLFIKSNLILLLFYNKNYFSTY